MAEVGKNDESSDFQGPCKAFRQRSENDLN